jgi:hypothetical protein
MQCIGRTKGFRRCKNQAARVFCHTHRWQPLVAAVGLLGFIGAAAGLFRDAIEPLLAYWGDSSRRVELTEDYPVKFGHGRDKVLRLLGQPQDEDAVFQSFYTEGLRIYYGPHTQKVDGFVVAPYESGVVFRGSVLGLHIGDSFDRAKARHGKPEHWGLPNSDLSLALWRIDENILAATLDRTAPDASRITSLVICTEASFAYYEAIAAITASELRRGLRPSFLEEGAERHANLVMPFDDPVFASFYEVIGTRLGEWGGGWTYVRFGTGAVVAFWIYPLGGETARVRGIFKISDKGKVVSPKRD